MGFLSENFGPVISITALVIGALVVLWVISRFARIYRIVPPDVALVISGGSKKPKIVIGGSTFVWPIINQAEELSLKLMLVKKTADAVKSKSGMTVLIDWFAQARFSPEEEDLRTAARLFLGKDKQSISQDIEEVLSGNMRAIAGDLTVEEMHNDRDKFIEAVTTTAEDELKQLGVIVILGIQEITDNEDYFKSLAAPAIASVKEKARVAVAEADRVAGIAEETSRQEVEQAKIDADREILTQKEALELRRVDMDKKIGIEVANKDLEVNKIRVTSEEKKAEADELVPARAKAEAVKIEADGKSQEIKLVADANAHKTEKEGAATASALEAYLLAEAKGKKELADAIASEDKVNLIIPLTEILAKADVEKTQAVADAVAGLGGNVKIWDLAGGGKNGENTMTSFVGQIPQLVQQISTQVEALTGKDVGESLAGIIEIFNNPTLFAELQKKITEVGEMTSEVTEEDSTTSESINGEDDLVDEENISEETSEVDEKDSQDLEEESNEDME